MRIENKFKTNILTPLDLDKLMNIATSFESWKMNYMTSDLNLLVTVKTYIYSRDTFPIIRDLMESSDTKNIFYYYKHASEYKPTNEYNPENKNLYTILEG